MLNLLQFIFPHTCILCGGKNKMFRHPTLNDSYLDLCLECKQDLPLVKHFCARCATPLPATIFSIGNTETLCGACLKTTPPFAKTIAPYLYQAPIDYLIAKLKFQKQLIYAKLLGVLLAEYLVKYYHDRNKPQVVVPIPLHKYRLRERGFNQSLEIAKPLAKILHIPINKNNCMRHKHTEPQSSLNAKERQKNVHNAFAITGTCFADQYVAVLDDVITTGNTIREFCYCLQRARVCRIDVWAFAHARSINLGKP